LIGTASIEVGVEERANVEALGHAGHGCGSSPVSKPLPTIAASAGRCSDPQSAAVGDGANARGTDVITVRQA
jgi:hypothetical protein